MDGFKRICKKYADPCPWASKFKGAISSEIENLPVKNEGDILTCPNYLISEDKILFVENTCFLFSTYTY